MREFQLYGVDLRNRYTVAAGKQGIGDFRSSARYPYLGILHIPYNNTSLITAAFSLIGDDNA